MSSFEGLGDAEIDELIKPFKGSDGMVHVESQLQPSRTLGAARGERMSMLERSWEPLVAQEPYIIYSLEYIIYTSCFLGCRSLVRITDHDSQRYTGRRLHILCITSRNHLLFNYLWFGPLGCV